MADLQKQFDLEMKIRDQLSQLHQTVNDIRTTRVQFHGLQGRLSGDPRFKNILASADALDKKMTPVEEQLLQVKIKSSEASLNYPVLIDEQLHGLFFLVDLADAAPTQQEYAAVDELTKQSNPLIAQWKQIMSTDLVALNEMMQKENVPAIYIAPAMGEGSTAKAAGQK
jgi:hypothetical protein